ncbi:hypothetical protein JKF63_04513 [Porcisia hertigi]|uniref:DRBM domain-containing protein n=1 Tax=Porcisia hertigi TaxID=2761500 RepID=A0A836L8B9_9TRYP|nr:hypothetical protein JKF63_04513 [Porcisia hertigi]
MLQSWEGLAGRRLYRPVRPILITQPLCTVAQRRRCSTLGQIESVFKTLRYAKGIEGGAMRLCITEDMRVVVEHQPRSDSGTLASAHEMAVWQGTLTSTVQEALNNLHPSDRLLTSPSSLHVGLTAPVPSSSPTIIDLTRVRSDELRGVIRFVEQRYPELRLLVRHTSGQDLQGRQLHTTSVELAPRGIGVAVASLGAEQQRLVELFKGEAVGEGYIGCMRRAFREAFAAADLAYPSGSLVASPSLSVLSLYSGIWSSDGFSLCLMPGASPDHVECTLRHGATGKSLKATQLRLTGEGLRTLLKFCDDTAAEHYADRHASVQERLRSAPLHLVLPRCNLRVKHLLRRLLFYYYSIDEEDVIFRTETLSGSMHKVQVQARLHSPTFTDLACDSTGLFLLGKATGNSKNSAVEFATVQALQTLFPEIFERDIAYHPEVRAILTSNNATASDDVVPHPGQGLETQLRWALRRENSTFELETWMLKPNSTYPEWGVAAGVQPVWVSQLYIVRGFCDANAIHKPALASATSRELCCCAFDGRKARSEQKAIAAALAQRFPALCRRCVDQAREKKLIDAEGAPAPCDGVKALPDANGNIFAAALSSDPFLKLVDPHKFIELQSLPAVQTSDSVLEGYWCATKVHTSFLGSIRVVREADRAVYVARCMRPCSVHEAPEQVIAEATGSTEIGALFAVLKKMQDLPEVVCRDASTTASSETGLLSSLPSALPDASPLQTCVEAIARLYGLHCSVSIRKDGARYRAELWSTTPEESALSQAHSRFSANPFAEGRLFHLGRGSADTPLSAIVRAAQQIFESHVRIHQRAFSEEVVTKGHVRLRPDAQGSLSRLCDAVVAEIKCTSTSAVSDNWLLFEFEHNQLSDLSFRVTSDKRSVVLEHVVGKNLLSCAREMATRISHETSEAFLSPAHMSALVAQTAEQLLRTLCLRAYGLTLQTQTYQRSKMWHCRLSLQISDEMAYSIAQASGLRKKETVEASAVAALREYFAEELRHIPSFSTLPAVVSLEGPIGAPGGAQTKSDCETYAFHLCNAGSAGEVE